MRERRLGVDRLVKLGIPTQQARALRAWLDAQPEPRRELMLEDFLRVVKDNPVDAE